MNVLPPDIYDKICDVLSDYSKTFNDKVFGIEQVFLEFANRPKDIKINCTKCDGTGILRHIYSRCYECNGSGLKLDKPE